MYSLVEYDWEQNNTPKINISLCCQARQRRPSWDLGPRPEMTSREAPVLWGILRVLLAGDHFL